jgi:RNA recognition motif-containing protein
MTSATAQAPPRFSWQVNDAAPAAGSRAASGKRRQPQHHQQKQKKPKRKREAPSADPSNVTDTQASSESGGTSAHSKKKRARRDDGDEPLTASVAGQAADSTDGTSGWRVFVGQLPFYLTDDRCIRKHFAQAGCDVAGVRMLSDKTTKKFRGVAFVELSDKESLAAALKLHQSRLGHKKIVVELSAGGGGNSIVRKEKIKAKRVRVNAQAEAARQKRDNKGRDANAVPVGRRPEQ